MSEDQSSAANGGTDPMKRLASFRTPRDLTLGGVKTNKKVFTPNLNVTRNKNKGPIIKQNNQKKEEKDKKDKKNDRNKNFKHGPNIIKSSGVFSEGLASAERHSSRGSFYNRESESVQSMQRPTIRVKDVIKIDKELEEQKIKSVMGDTDHAGESDSEEDFRTTKAHDAPVQLPMGGVGWQVKPTVKVKPELYIKSEPDELDCETVDKKPPIPDIYETYEQMDVVNILKSEEPKLILLQLPPLPGRGKSEEVRPRRRIIDDDEPSTSTESAEPKTDKPADTCNLADLDEGRIGKMRIHRSGRVSMTIGHTLFDVSLGTHASFLQEVMSMAKDDESRSANLITLGQLQHKLLITPNHEDLFQRMKLNK